MTAVCGGGLAAVTLAYHYNTGFRSLVHENLPVIEPLLRSLDSYLDNKSKPANIQGDARNLPSAGDPLNLGVSTPHKVRLHVCPSN